MGRKKKLEFYDKMYIEKNIKTIKRSYVTYLTRTEIIVRIDKYNMLDNNITNCFKTYTNFTTNLYFDYINKKHIYADKTCKQLLDYFSRPYDHYCQVCTKKNEFYIDIRIQAHNYIYDVLRLIDFTKQCTNHINLNLLKKTKIPNDVIDAIISKY